MHWIAPSEKDPSNGTLEKQLTNRELQSVARKKLTGNLWKYL